MKKRIVLLLIVLFFGCAQERIPKPEPLLSLEQMTNFHVDLALLNAASSYETDSFVPMDSLYAFHRIDSVTFAKNHIYYASKPKVYIKIFEEVKTTLESMEEVDTLPELEKSLSIE